MIQTNFTLAPNLLYERTGNSTLIDDRQQNSGLTFDDIDLWQDTEFCERKPYHKVNELELLAGTVVGLARASVDLTVASAKFINEFFAEAQRFDDAWNYESVPNQQAMQVWSVNQDYVRNEVRNFIPNVKMAAIAGYHNFAEAMRNIEQDPFNAGYKIGYVGGSVALTGYGTLALARNSVPLILNIEKQTYVIGTKGYAQGRASYTLINALNSSPVVGATATELFASTNTPRQLLFSQIRSQGSRSSSSMYIQGNSANLAYNGGNAVKHSKIKPSTRKDLHEDLIERGFKLNKETPRDYNQGVGGGTVTYKGPDGRTVTLKDTGEVIMVKRKWTADGTRKYPERQDYIGNRLLDQSHSTGHFVEPYIGPHKPKGPGL